MTKSALVTGSAGLVGRAMHAELDRAGYDVTCVDTKGGTDALDVFASDAYFDLVVHCAAHVGGRADIDGKPLFLAANNLQLDAALFDWALRTRPGRVCFFSSSAAYPTLLQEPHPSGCPTTRRPLPLHEDEIDYKHPDKPDASYGMVKLVGEQLAALATAEGVRTHVFRPFSGYSPAQDDSYPWPALVARVKRRDSPLTIWSDGSQVRDWIHIEDVVGAVMACIDQEVLGPINLCTGRGVSFTELATMMAEYVGYTPKFDYKLDAPRGVTYRVGDPTRLHEVYVPKLSVEDGIRRSLRG